MPKAADDTELHEAAVRTLAAMLWDADNSTRLSDYSEDVQAPVLSHARRIIGMASYRPVHEVARLSVALMLANAKHS